MSESPRTLIKPLSATNRSVAIFMASLLAVMVGCDTYPKGAEKVEAGVDSVMTSNEDKASVVAIRSTNGDVEICFRVPANLRRSSSVDKTSLTIEFDNMRDLLSYGVSSKPVFTSMGRYRLVLDVYDSQNDRNAALQRLAASGDVIEVLQYLVNLNSATSTRPASSILAVHRTKLLGVTFYLVFDLNGDKLNREKKIEEALTFINSILVSCKEN